MEPIISPWIIYVLHVFDKLYFAGGMLLMCCATIAPILAIIGDMEDSASMMKYAKILAIVAVICALVLIIVPDKNTLTAMLAATYITPDNIKLIQGNIVDFVQQISNATQR